MNLDAFLDELEKIAAATSFAKAKGLKRVGQLLTGSHHKALAARFRHLMDRGSSVGKSPGDPTHRMRANTLAMKHYTKAFPRIGAQFREAKAVDNARVAATLGAAVLGGTAATAAAMHHAMKPKKKKKKESHE